MARCATRIRPAQDALQPVPALDGDGRFRQDFQSPCGTRRPTRHADDRRHTPQGSPDGLQPLKRGILPRHIGRTKGGLNTKLHAVCDAEGRPLAMCLTAGQTSDHVGAKILYPALPEETGAVLIAGKGYDSGEYRDALGRPSRSPLASRPGSTARHPPHTAKRNTNSGIRWRTCSAG